jgi:hypothetical protein
MVSPRGEENPGSIPDSGEAADYSAQRLPANGTGPPGFLNT